VKSVAGKIDVVGFKHEVYAEANFLANPVRVILFETFSSEIETIKELFMLRTGENAC
jgi:hypothetical protein